VSGGPGLRPRANLPNGYGKPLQCPKCSAKEETFYGKLKLPGEKDTPCPNCGERLVAPPRRR
jgi:DNA-directed RNA polymerase subunit RPC12/RpoP